MAAALAWPSGTGTSGAAALPERHRPAVRALLSGIVTTALAAVCGSTAALAEHRPDLEIRLSGAFVNHFQEGRGQLVNYYASVKPPAGGGTPGGVQVVIFDKPRGYTAQWFHDSYVDAYSKNYGARSDQTIDGAACSRFSNANNTSRVHWECLFGDYEIIVAKQEAYGVKIDEVALLRTLLQRLGATPQLTPSEVAFRNVLFRTGLKFAGDAARSCLDEVMNTAEAAAASDAKMAVEIAQLRKAAARAHAIEVLAALPVGPEYFDDFDPKWWEAVKEVTPNPFAPSDPRDTSTDVVVDLLPPALKWLINITRAADKGMRAIKKHVVDRAMQGELFACYRTIRPNYPAVISRASAEAYEEQLSHILFDVVGSCHSANAAGFQAGYGKVSDEEFRRLSRPVAVRFEVIYQIEDARNHRDARIEEHWAPVQDILARLKARVNACIADRASRSR